MFPFRGNVLAIFSASLFNNDLLLQMDSLI